MDEMELSGMGSLITAATAIAESFDRAVPEHDDAPGIPTSLSNIEFELNRIADALEAIAENISVKK